MNKKALLIINLGSPASPEVKDVKSYLNQFLMDGDVIDVFYPLRAFLVKALIVPFRSKKSSEAYKEIFTERGSPLIFHTKDFVDKLSPKVQPKFQCVEYAMRYGEPSIESKIIELQQRGCSDLVALPMYPQFAKSSSRTVLREIQRALSKIKATEINVRTWIDFFGEDFFIQSFSTAIQEEISTFKPDHLLLSYHGLPENHVKEFAPQSCFRTPHCCANLTKANRLCYRAQCFETSRKIHAHLDPIDFTVSFQSRLGKQEWIKPYTDIEIERILEKGAKRVLVACPAFVADCLETLEEISLRLRDDFISKGGEDLKLVPSLNSRDQWVEACAQYLKSARFQPLVQALNKVQ